MSYDLSGFSSMKLGYRNTRCLWGTHIACLFQTEGERDRFVNGFFHRGLQDRDRLVYCSSRKGTERFKHNLLENNPDFREDIRNPRTLRVLSAEETYYSPEGRFSPDGLDRALQSIDAEGGALIRKNLRVAVDMSWALEEGPGLDDMMAYEAEMNLLVPRRNIVAVCLYDLNRFSNEMIMGTLRTHPFTLTRGILSPSSYYEPPTRYMMRGNSGRFSYQSVSGI